MTTYKNWEDEYEDEFVYKPFKPKIDKNKFCKKNKIDKNKYGPHIYSESSSCCEKCGHINKTEKKL